MGAVATRRPDVADSTESFVPSTAREDSQNVLSNSAMLQSPRSNSETNEQGKTRGSKVWKSLMQPFSKNPQGRRDSIIEERSINSFDDRIPDAVIIRQPTSTTIQSHPTTVHNFLDKPGREN